MTPRERRIYHRRAERLAVKQARYALRNADYPAAARAVVYAMQQETAAECAEREERAEKLGSPAKEERLARYGRKKKT
jgi:hypothetical protein